MSAYLEETIGMDVPLLTGSTAYGTPFFLSPWVGDVGSTFIAGPTGAGKSTLIGLLAIQFLKYPEGRVIMFDVGRSAQKMTMAVGGRYYEPGIGVGFQPLRDLDSEEDILWAAEFMELIYSMQGLKVTPGMTVAINAALRLLRKAEKKDRTLTHFSHQVKYQEGGKEPLKEAIAPYLINGQYGHILDSDHNEVGLDPVWTCFEMRPLMNLGEKIVVPVLYYLFRILDVSFEDKKLKAVYLDEVWRFFNHEIFLKKIREMLKTVRKQNVHICLATQELNDAYNSEIASTVLEQCLTKIFLANPMAKEAMNIYQAFGLNEKEIMNLSQAMMKQDYFYKSPLGVRMFRLDMGRIALTLTGTETPEKIKEWEMIKEQNPEREYLDIIMEDKDVAYKQYLK
jgi:type IV secretion system protein VirB4